MNLCVHHSMPQVWFEFSLTQSLLLGADKAAAVLSKAVRALPSCTMLRLALADLVESQGRVADAHQVGDGNKEWQGGGARGLAGRMELGGIRQGRSMMLGEGWQEGGMQSGQEKSVRLQGGSHWSLICLLCISVYPSLPFPLGPSCECMAEHDAVPLPSAGV